MFRFTKLQPPDRQGFFLLYSVCFWFVLVKLLENDKNKQVITIHNSKIESISALKKELKTAEKIFQTAYQSGMVPKTECQRWLWEHILDLEEELHHLFIDLRNFSRHGKERIRLFQALEEAVTKTEGLCQKNLLKRASFAANQRSLGNRRCQKHVPGDHGIIGFRRMGL